MNDSSDEPPLSKPPLSWARIPAISRLNPFGSGESSSEATSERILPQHNVPHKIPGSTGVDASEEMSGGKNIQHQQDRRLVDKKGEGEEPAAIAEERQEPKLSLGTRFKNDVKHIAFSSWINVLLVFVPVGIALGALVKAKGGAAPVSPSVVFAINAIAIIPLASMLSFATESVALKLGDTIGALLNVTFGNAVELIIFIIALVAGEIRIVQASLLGSILANLLLILGMCFVFGGLRFREQLYNSTASQMGAVLLGLAVVSLLLPTAFHASFNNTAAADRAVVKVSRGTSVILLIVYGLYLYFQLKSHAYMYASTPQHLIDEESHPGLLAEMMNSSSSSSDSSSSSETDSDSSSGSHTTAKRIKRLVRRKRRKSNASSKNTSSPPSFMRTPSSTTNNNSIISALPHTESPIEISSNPLRANDTVFSGDEADVDGETSNVRRTSANTGITSHDFEDGAAGESKGHRFKEKPKKRAKAIKKAKNSKRKHKREKDAVDQEVETKDVVTGSSFSPGPHVGFMSEVQEIPDANAAKRPFHMRNISSAVRPTLPKGLASTVFTHHEAIGRSMPVPTLRPGLPRPATAASKVGVRRASSLPDIHKSMSGSRSLQAAGHQASYPPIAPTPSQASIAEEDIVDDKKHLSQTSAILLLLFSTGLVAICAEFLVDSIDYLVNNSGVSQAFVGLIILPIVGNAAEHVTAVTVATKNKMDLAINVAVGSSIQIALFVTPLIVILGWIIGRDMSLYFSLFETVSLFASAFIVSLLLIDGRTNYLEGALLIAAYIIIAVAAFFYPTCDLSLASGPADSTSSC